MKKIFFLTLLAIFNGNIFATSEALSSALTAVALTGTVYTVNSFQYDEWLNTQINSWKNEQTNSTIALSHSSGINLELTLHKTRRFSYIMFNLSNQTGYDITIPLNDVELRFPNGKVRKIKSINNVSDFKVDQSWIMRAFFPIPNKEDLKDVDSVELIVPVRGEKGEHYSEIKATLQKNKNTVPTFEEYNRLLTADFIFYYGVNSFTSSNLKYISQFQGVFGIAFNFFFYNQHGLGFMIQGQDLKSDANQNLKGPLNKSNLDLHETNLQLGYSGHKLYGREFNLSWSGGLNFYSLINREQNQKSDEIKKKTGLYANVEFHKIIFSNDLNIMTGDYMIGGGINLKYIPNFNFGNYKLGGYSAIPFLSFKMGF
jgi:hypothetical protein